MMVFTLILVACNDKELQEGNVSSEVSTPAFNIVSDYVLIGEIQSSNEYLKNEMNNIKVYGKSMDDFGNYTEVKFVYKENVWISDEIKVFAEKEMQREDVRQLYLPLLEDRDVITIIYFEKEDLDSIKENILFFDQNGFTPIIPEELNISVIHKPSSYSVEIGDISYKLSVVEKTKVDSSIFDRKVTIAKNMDNNVEVCALKKDQNNNYYDIYVRLLYTNKVFKIAGRKQFEYKEPHFNILDINSDGNDELVINFYEKTGSEQITQSVCFMDINTGKEVSLSDLGVQELVKITYKSEKQSVAEEGNERREYKVSKCQYTRKEELNKDTYSLVPAQEIMRTSGDSIIILSVLYDPISFITENGNPRVFMLKCADKIGLFRSWTMNRIYPIDEYGYPVEIEVADVNNDGLNEIIVKAPLGGGTGYTETEIHIIDSSTLEEIEAYRKIN